MAAPTISIGIVTDANAAVAGIDDARGALEDLAGSAKDASSKVDSASAAVRDLGDDADAAAAKTRDVSGAIDEVGGTAGGVTTGLRDMSDAVEMLGFEKLAAGMGLAAVGFEAIDGAATLWNAVAPVAAKVTTAMGKAFNFLKVTILTNPIFWIAAIIIGIVAAFILLYQKCEGFRKVVDAVFKFAWNLIKGFWNWIKGAFAALLNILSKPWKIMQTVVRTVMNLVKAIISKLVDWIGAYIQFIVTFWKNVFNSVVNLVRSAIDKVANIIRSIVDTVKGIVNKVKEVFSNIYNAIKEPFEKAMQWVKDHFKLPKLDLNPFDGKSAEAAGLTVAPTVRAAPRAQSGSNVTINITGPISTHDTVRELRKLFREDQARLGRASLRPVIA